MTYLYETRGAVCSSSIKVTLQGDVVQDVEFEGGCDGNLKAIRRLVRGMTADQVEGLFLGVTCEDRGTSCPDQMARAVREALEQVKGKPDNEDVQAAHYPNRFCDGIITPL